MTLETDTRWTAPDVERPGGSLVAPEEWAHADRAVAGRDLDGVTGA